VCEAILVVCGCSQYCWCTGNIWRWDWVYW